MRAALVGVDFGQGDRQFVSVPRFDQVGGMSHDALFARAHGFDICVFHATVAAMRR
jgi:hypothetical protein